MSILVTLVNILKNCTYWKISEKLLQNSIFMNINRDLFRKYWVLLKDPSQNFSIQNRTLHKTFHLNKEPFIKLFVLKIDLLQNFSSSELNISQT